MNARQNHFPLSVLKYSAQIGKAVDYPPVIAGAFDGVGYRIVTNNIADVNNFLPQAFITPHRSVIVSGNQRASMEKICAGYALSMYCSVEQLVAKTQSVMQNAPQFLKRVGNCFAKVQLKPADGFATPTADSGHFGFFESSNFLPLTAVVEHQKLPL